jgi:hypothetical protein
MLEHGVMKHSSLFGAICKLQIKWGVVNTANWLVLAMTGFNPETTFIKLIQLVIYKFDILRLGSCHRSEAHEGAPLGQAQALVINTREGALYREKGFIGFAWQVKLKLFCIEISSLSVDQSLGKGIRKYS